MSTAKEILGNHKLRTTGNRLEVLKLFMHQGSALSQPEIEHQMNEICDRVTIYRTISTFMDHGILHKVLDDAGAMKYALCASGCNSEVLHFHDHVHFKCTICGNTTCIDEVHIPTLGLPSGYKVQETNILLQGTCPSCS